MGRKTKPSIPAYPGERVVTFAFVLVSSSYGPKKTIVNNYLLEPEVYQSEQGPCASITPQLVHAYKIDSLHEAQRIRDVIYKGTKLKFGIHRVNVDLTTYSEEADEGGDK